MKAEFYILGALHRGDFHPYEIKRRLNNALVECYTDVDVGTLYYAVRQLAKSGDIAPKTTQKVKRGGERTIYRITSQGRSRFQKLFLERFHERGPQLFRAYQQVANASELFARALAKVA